ncbi:MAG: cation:proton antiporter [Patescibacteria group bacterium]|nr:cation:proton antiporter [Patescibacteria group bacterium]
MDVFIEIAQILAVAAGVSIAMRFLRQPLIVGYIITGILVGPSVLNIFRAEHELELLSKFGITILLFLVGLSLSPRVIKDLGKVSLATGIGQIVFTSLIGFGIALAIGIPRLAALYTAIALTFSSTIIIVKLLSDKKDLNKLYGKIAIGFLLVQDLVATILLIFFSTLSSSTGENPYTAVGFALIKGFALIAVILVLSSFVIPRLYRWLAQSQEMLFLISIAWGLGLAALFHVIGFSAEIGALVAGVAIAATPFAYEVGARLRPLRDFFIVLFFVLLGANMLLDNIGSLIVPSALLSVFVLVGNPAIVIVIMNLLGYNRRTGFHAGLATAQISEFSLILATIGFEVGHLSKDVLSIITMVGLVTISVSTYMIMYSDRIYNWVGPWLRFLELRKIDLTRETTRKEYVALLFGYDRVGHDFVGAFTELGKKFLVVDYNPESISRLEQEGLPFVYGDADDLEFLHELNLQDVQIVVSTIPSFQTNALLVQQVKLANAKAIVIVLAHDASEAKELYARGATYVIVPHYLGARYASRMIVRHGVKRSEYEAERGKHLEYLYKHYAHNLR